MNLEGSWAYLKDSRALVKRICNLEGVEGLKCKIQWMRTFLEFEF
jgi:hypothetical protein